MSISTPSASTLPVQPSTASVTQDEPVSISTSPAVQISTQAAVPPENSSSISTAAVQASTASFALPGLKPGETFPAPATASKEGRWVVGEIVILGTRNVKPNVIRGQVRARKAMLYSQNDMDKDIQAILGLGSFDRATVDIEPMPGQKIPEEFLSVAASTYPIRLKYTVVEKPVIKKILFEGQKNIYKGTLSDAISLKTKDPLDDSKLREDTIKLLTTYHDKGFIDAQVSPETSPPDKDNQVEVTFHIVEGPKANVREVRLEGVAAFKLKKLIKQMTNRPKKIYKPKDLDADSKNIEKYYQARGYAECRVLSSSVTFSPDRTGVFLDLKVQEGVLSRFGATTFSGNSVYTSQELAQALTYRAGKIFNQERFEETIQALQEKYAEKGYLRAQILPQKEPNPRTGLTDIHLQIAEGRVIYVDHIDVDGNKATRTYVLRREIVQREGEPFNAAKIRKSQEKLFNLGFLEDVKMDINNTPDPDKVDLVFDVVEGKPGMMTAGAGFSSLDGLVGTLSLSHLNLLGRAYRTSIQWQFGSRVQDYSISWTTPWVGTHPTSLGVDVFNTRRLRPFETTTTAFTDRRTGGRVRVGPRFEDDEYQLSLSYALQKVTVSDVQDQFLTQLPQGTSVTSSFSIEFARDTRDNIWDPSRGSRHSISYELAGGPLMGDVNYYRPGLSDSWFFKTPSPEDFPLVLSFANRFGFIERFGASDVPVFERYFIGGQDTIRGYQATGQVGPPFGGKVYDAFNIEYKFPLAREHRHNIVEGAFFFDIGNSWGNLRSIDLRIGSGDSRLKMGAGFGIRFVTPAFPIRLDWGYGFNHKPGEQQSQIYFTLGNIF